MVPKDRQPGVEQRLDIALSLLETLDLSTASRTYDPSSFETDSHAIYWNFASSVVDLLLAPETRESEGHQRGSGPQGLELDAVLEEVQAVVALSGPAPRQHVDVVAEQPHDHGPGMKTEVGAHTWAVHSAALQDLG